MPDVSQPEISEKEKVVLPQVQFFHIEHSAEAAEGVWEEAKDSDIVLVEVTNIDQVERKELEDLVNGISSYEDRDLRTEMVGYMHEGGLFASDSFVSQIVSNAAIEGKEIAFIDLNLKADNEAAKHNSESDSKFKKSDDLFSSGNFLESFMMFRSGVVSEAQSDLIREYAVSDQVTEFIENRDDLAGKRIAVIQGRWHTATYRHFKKQNPNVPTSRTFMKPNPVVFSSRFEAKARLLRSSEADREAAIQRIFLKRYIIPSAILLRRADDYLDDDQILKLEDRIVRSMDTTELAGVFKELFSIQERLLDLKDEPELAEYYAEKHLAILSNGILDKHDELLPEKLREKQR